MRSKQPNPEEIIRKAYYLYLLKVGVEEAKAVKTSNNPGDRHKWQRAESQAYQEESGSTKSVPIGDLAEYVNGKYNKGVESPQEEVVTPCTELVIRIEGGVQDTNLEEYRTHWQQVLDSINLTPQNDLEFGALESTIKDLKKAEQAANKVIADAMSGSADVSSVLSTAKSLVEDVRKTRLAGEKAVKTQKAAVKKRIINNAEKDIRDYVVAHRKARPDLEGYALCDGLGPITDATARKKTVETMEAAVFDAVVELRADIDERVESIGGNIDFIDACEYPELFADRKTLCVKGREIVAAEVEVRVLKHKQQLQEREDRAKEEARAKEEEKRYTLSDFLNEAAECRNEYHLENWWEKHRGRAEEHLSQEEVEQVGNYVRRRLNDLRGTPPPPDDPPGDINTEEQQAEEVGGGAEEPEEWRMCIEFDALCTVDQLRALGGALSELLTLSPYIIQGTCSLKTRD